ncbi:MAG: FAD-dependent thymidylate synthase [Candidatus Aminicenantes bacterium]|nr:FAD-dependent thymidylate synthase [Candidatus Aminicenantes bacterium]
MNVVLAGYNVDREALDELRLSAPPRLDLTPETLSAAYARISRDARPVDELRRSARGEVEKARRSNQAIIFKMGHHSVAEHAVFNFDLMGLSRLAIEAVERFRLASFTEKSQRYITLGEDFVVPEEIVAAGMKQAFLGAVKAQNAFYHRLYRALRPRVFARHPEAAKDPKMNSLLEGWAKEDARYIVSLATEGQLGMTVNARNLELMIRRFAAHPLAEVRELNRRLHDLATQAAPSIVLFTAATSFDAETYGALAKAAGKARPAGKGIFAAGTAVPVRLTTATADGDDRILAALLHTVSGRPLSECLTTARKLPARRKRALFLTVFERMEFYDFPPREFEHADLTFELVLSASAFAQLKRHRMATLTVQDYDPSLGLTVPPSIEEAGAAEDFRAMAAKTEEAHDKLKRECGGAAAYVLTNAHRRRALLKLNLRELYHISRLREDGAAQWDIREIAAAMSRAARTAFPLAAMMLGGKDAYPALYEKAFGHLPKQMPPAKE